MDMWNESDGFWETFRPMCRVRSALLQITIKSTFLHFHISNNTHNLCSCPLRKAFLLEVFFFVWTEFFLMPQESLRSSGPSISGGHFSVAWPVGVTGRAAWKCDWGLILKRIYMLLLPFETTKTCVGMWSSWAADVLRLCSETLTLNYSPHLPRLLNSLR